MIPARIPILHVGNIYVGRHGIVSPYPVGEGLDMLVTGPSRIEQGKQNLGGPIGASAIDRELRDGMRGLMDDRQLQAEAQRFQNELQRGLECIRWESYAEALQTEVQKQRPEFRFHPPEEKISDYAKLEQETDRQLKAADVEIKNKDAIMRRMERSEQYQQHRELFMRVFAEHYLGVSGLTPEHKAAQPDLNPLIEHIVASPQTCADEMQKYLAGQRDRLKADPLAACSAVADAYADAEFGGDRARYHRSLAEEVKEAPEIFGRTPNITKGLSDVNAACVWNVGPNITPYIIGADFIAIHILGENYHGTRTDEYYRFRGNKGVAGDIDTVMYVCRECDLEDGDRKETPAAMLRRVTEEGTHLLEQHHPVMNGFKEGIAKLPRSLAPFLDSQGWDEERIQEVRAAVESNPVDEQEPAQFEDGRRPGSGATRRNPLDLFAEQLTEHLVANRVLYTPSQWASEDLAAMFQYIAEARDNSTGRGRSRARQPDILSQLCEGRHRDARHLRDAALMVQEMETGIESYKTPDDFTPPPCPHGLDALKTVGGEGSGRGRKKR